MVLHSRRDRRLPHRCLFLAFGLLLFQSSTPHAQEPPRPVELNTLMMESTFMISGPQADGQIAYGTGFILGRPLKTEPSRGAFVLVTAKHVLETIAGQSAILSFRIKNAGGSWEKKPLTIPIRDGQRQLWTAHPGADVVALYLNLPAEANFKPLSTDLLANDAALTQLEVHPGDEVTCLGFPLQAQSNDVGFPVLRSGKIASYPLLPTNSTKTFLMDFSVMPGNSGGPVFFVDTGRVYGGAVHLGQTNYMIVGLVVQERYIQERVSRVFLNLAVVVHASLIKDLITLMPEPAPAR